MIDAPVEKVFDTVAHIENYSKAVLHIVSVKFLTDSKTGVGTRFVETRMMKDKKASTELEVTEYVENDSVRMVSDTHGTVWDTIFTFAAKDGGTELTMVMDARAHKLLPKLMNLLVKGMITKAVAKDMDALKAYCEASDTPAD